MKRRGERGIILQASCFLYFFNKLYEAIIKRKGQHSVGISKFTAPLGHYTFLCGINTFGVKNRFLLK